MKLQDVGVGSADDASMVGGKPHAGYWGSHSAAGHALRDAAGADIVVRLVFRRCTVLPRHVQLRDGLWVRKARAKSKSLAFPRRISVSSYWNVSDEA